MTTRRGSSTGTPFRGSLLPRDRFTLSVDLLDVVDTPGTHVDSVVDDANIRTHIGATLIKQAQASVLRPPGADVVVFTVENESLGAITSNGLASGIGEGGTTRIKASTSGRTVYSDPVALVTVTPATTIEFLSYINGSLGKACSDVVDDAIATGNVEDLLPMYISGNTRNPNCWPVAAGYDISCIDRNKPNAAFIGTSNGYSYAIQAGHYPDGLDTYVSMAGSVQQVSVAAFRRVGPLVSAGLEIRVVRYATALTNGCVPAILPPADFADYFSQLQYGVPCLCTDQEKKALVTDLYLLNTFARYQIPANAKRLAFYESKISGDSGAPNFLLLDGRLMLVTNWTFGGAGAGPNHAYYLAEIQAAIESMGGDWNDFEIADLSAYGKMIDGVWSGL